MSNKKYAPQDSQIMDDRDVLMAFGDLLIEVPLDDFEVDLLLEEVGLAPVEIGDEITTLMAELRSSGYLGWRK